MATFCLRPIEGISRPAIAAIWPTLRADIIVLDVGATIGGDAKQLVDFSILGAALATCAVRHGGAVHRPPQCRHRGDEGPRRSARGSRHAHRGQRRRFHAITASSRATTSARARSTSSSPKASPATSRSRPPRARPVRSAPMCALRSGPTFSRKLGALLAGKALNAIRRKLDPRNVNGGVFLGSTASSSRATAAPTRSASRARWASPTRWRAAA